MKYNAKIVLAYFKECGLPKPETEYKFHLPERKWPFDFGWPDKRVALEVDGGIWIHGAHNRGARIKKTWEKENTANLMGWHLYKCEPKDLCTQATVQMLQRALGLTNQQ